MTISTIKNLGVNKAYVAAQLSAYTPLDIPSITAPTASQTYFEGPFECSSFTTDDLFVGDYVSTDWQIASDSEFSTILYSADGTTEYSPTLLYASTTLYVRCRHRTDMYVSEWGAVVQFTTPAAYIQTPTISLSGSILVLSKSPVMYSTDFAVALGGTDIHSSSDWQVLDDTDTVVYESLTDTSNLTTLDLDGLVTLSGGTTYTFQVRHNGTSLSTSDWGAEEGITIEDWVNNTIYTDAEITTLIDTDGYIPISTADEMNQIGSDLSSTMTFGFNTDWEMTTASSTKTTRLTWDFILLSDINVSSCGNFNPIGKYGEFSGIFDGAGSIITNVLIDGNTSYTGLFGYVTGTIKNLGLMNPFIIGSLGSSTYGFTGGLVGTLIGTITNCFVSGGIIEGIQESTDSSSYATGGLCGYAISGSTISYCYSQSVIIGGYRTGGLIGQTYNNTITECFASGDIFNTVDSTIYGFCGSFNDTGSLTVTNCCADISTSGLNNSTENSYITYLSTYNMVQLTTSPISSWSSTYWDLGTTKQYPHLVSFGVVDGIDRNTSYDVIGEV